jgi:hypothetical protein
MPLNILVIGSGKKIERNNENIIKNILEICPFIARKDVFPTIICYNLNYNAIIG